MKVTKKLVRTAQVAAGAIGVVAIVAPDSTLGRSTRRLAARFARDLRYVAASAPGVVYRLSGRQPDPGVSDDILADRIRSAIGPVEHHLDMPRVHVTVEDHVAILHGEVPDERSAAAVEHAVMRVSGVRGVVSHLHAHLIPNDTRPSEGQRHVPRSDARLALVDSARCAGAHDPEAAVHAVLCGFLDRIPAGELEHVLTHLPADVRELAGPPRHLGERPTRLKTIPQLVAAVTAERGVEHEHAEAITRAVIATLRDLVPEEQRDIAAVLPAELRTFWVTQTAARS